LADIISQLGTEEFARLRIGIGPAPEGWDWSAHVLSKFNQQELPEIEQAVCRAADAAVVWALQGIEASMNRFN
jgi:PTH1 family peptidyl-tRNA hydrolase